MVRSSVTHPENLDQNILSSQFRELQGLLRQRWQKLESSLGDDSDILVIPSLSLDQEQLEKVAGVHHYEERHLFSLIRLRNPKTRLIYVTSQPLHPSVIDYYLQLLPGVPFSHARERLLLLSTYDSSKRALTEKILERPRLMERINLALRSHRSYMICFNATERERELSVRLNIPLWAPDPDLSYWGTKSGSRQIFAECDIPHPDGSPLVHNVEDLAIATDQLWGRQPQLKRVVIKLNESFSGEGNAVLDLRPLQNLSERQRLQKIQEYFGKMNFQAKGETWQTFSQRIPELGAIVEAFIEGENKRSPSVQCCINPDQTVEILSTHDQILGGPDGQIFLGCTFPADHSYRLALQELGMRIGENLARKGALERFAVDFVAVQDGEKWSCQAIEINLRRGGTTHPFMTLQLLTNGHYDLNTGLFYCKHQKPKYYKATDNLQKPQYRGLLPNDLMDIIAHHHLHFDTSTETGTIFHLMGCLSQYGKLGLTTIGNSPAEAEALFAQVENALDVETSHNQSWGLSPQNSITWQGKPQ